VVINVGDLVKVHDDYVGPDFARHREFHGIVGIVTDVLEDDMGFRHVEVEFVDDRGWFEDFVVRVVSSDKGRE